MAAPQTYLIMRDGARVAEFTDAPGQITSTAFATDPGAPDHPFVSGHELDPSCGQEIHDALSGARDFRHFLDRLRDAGFHPLPLPRLDDLAA